MDLDQLDAEVGGPLSVRDGARIIAVPPATQFHWRTVAAAIRDKYAFAEFVWPRGMPLQNWKLDVIHLAWIRHNGLTPMPGLQRLVYMMEKYADGIEYDLRHHLDVSAGELWRGRRWREMLGYIDQLPNDSHKNRMLSLDEEHMGAIIASQRNRQPSDAKPSMADWGQLESMMAVLIDAVNRNTEVTHAVAPGKKQPLRISNYPRPATAAEKVEHDLQKKQHEDMVAALLPAKHAGQVS